MVRGAAASTAPDIFEFATVVESFGGRNSEAIRIEGSVSYLVVSTSASKTTIPNIFVYFVSFDGLKRWYSDITEKITKHLKNRD